MDASAKASDCEGIWLAGHLEEESKIIKSWTLISPPPTNCIPFDF